VAATRGFGLSLGDRACLAVAAGVPDGVAVNADQALEHARRRRARAVDPLTVCVASEWDAFDQRRRYFNRGQSHGSFVS
jgi:hypothetical protein